MHLILNLFVQIIFGIALEHYFEAYRVAIVYIIGVIAGSVTGALVAPDKKVIGSSAGAYTVALAFVVFFARVRFYITDVKFSFNFLCHIFRIIVKEKENEYWSRQYSSFQSFFLKFFTTCLTYLLFFKLKKISIYTYLEP